MFLYGNVNFLVIKFIFNEVLVAETSSEPSIRALKSAKPICYLVYFLIYNKIYLPIYGESMGKPMMLQEDDDARIEVLKRKLGAKSKIEVLRAALTLLEQSAERAQRIKRWKKAAKLASDSSYEVLQEFSGYSGLKKDA